jgi:hypothetical protein
VLRGPWSWFLVTRLIIALIGVVGVATFVNQHTGLVGDASALHPQIVWHKWDSLWYERIAQHGYGYQVDDIKGQAAAGFFPLYPLTIGVLMSVVPGLSFFWVGVVASNLFTLAALWLITRELCRDAEQVDHVMIATLAAAGSFYLSIPYTESLFLLLVAGVMVCVRRQWILVAAALAGLGCVTRVHGFALLAVPAIAVLFERDRSIGRRLGRFALVAMVSAVPLAMYMFYLAHVQGSAEAFVTRQAMWSNAFPYPLKAFVGLLEYPRRISGWLHGGFWVLYAWVLARAWRRLPLGEAVFCAGALLISTQQESFHGIYRYTMPLLPLAIGLSDDTPTVRTAVMVINVIFGTIMILAYVTNNRLTV